VNPDDELLADLRRIAGEVDGAPELVTETARAAFSTRRLDDELAELLSDSDLTAAAVRGDGPRLLSFATAQVSLELQIAERDGQVSVRGLVVGPSREIEVQTLSTAVRSLTADGTGWFRADDLPAEPLRIRVESMHGPAVTTGWISP
jgi:hypothetical protein